MKYADLTPLRSIHEAVMLAGLGINLNSAELTLTSGVTIFAKTIFLLSGSMLLCRYDATMLIKDKLRLCKSTGGFVSGAVPDLSPRTF